MTTLELKLILPDGLAREAQAAGLLNSLAVEEMLRERLRKRAGEELRVMMNKIDEAKLPHMTLEQIQDEVRAVRDKKRRGNAAS